METEFSHGKDDSCEYQCHPGPGAGGCPGCAHMHGSGKMDSMDPFGDGDGDVLQSILCSVFGVNGRKTKEEDRSGKWVGYGQGC